MKIFMNEKGKTVAELCDEKRLWNLALPCDMHHLNDLIPDFIVKMCLGLSEL